ncbi:aldehyde dehydrogenase domain-containing protein [Lipomyces japonicus]|uniref:aldehyde dehydrogenase domain-containing protein n=1 Tax=Lipomyces japonicus TaxID=56871 RepID=UPI0034CEC90E
MSTSKKIIPLIINGSKTVSKNTNLHIPIQSAANPGSPFHYAQAASYDQVIEAAEGSFNAFKKWKKVPAGDRREILLEAANLLKKRRHEGIELQVQESMPNQQFAEKMYDISINQLTELASLTTSIQHSVPPSESADIFPIVFQEPIGPVLGISPWNAASVLALRSIATPIAAGCTTIFKTSELSAGSQYHIANAIIDAGLPDGVLNVLHVKPTHNIEYVNSLISHPAVRKINFTGSTATGRKIAVTAAENLKPVLLELGGKASSIIFEDADLDKSAEASIIGSWLNQGQICMSTERIFVHEDILDNFTIKLTNVAKKIAPILGSFPQVTKFHADKIHDIVSGAVNDGAILAYGSLERKSATHVTPTIIKNVSPKSTIYHEESFGPTVLVVPFKNEKEAIELTNDTVYGLSASIWSKDVFKALRVSREIESGAVHINGMTVHDEATLPHGGMKNSGYGRFNGQWGLSEFTIPKTVTISGYSS